MSIQLPLPAAQFALVGAQEGFGKSAEAQKARQGRRFALGEVVSGTGAGRLRSNERFIELPAVEKIRE